MDLNPTPVFETFWKFAYERQEIYEKRKIATLPPYTNDYILNKYKFTNAYRASDRVSQYLIKEVIYSNEWSFQDHIFRILLFKLFNKISTWELLSNELGPISVSNTSIAEIDTILTRAINAGGKIYSGAYIMPSGKTTFGHAQKHKNNLQLLQQILNNNPDSKITKMHSFEELCAYLKSFPTIGPFLSYQYATDINYCPHTNFSESEFVIPGPGAISGVHKCFKNITRGTEAIVIQKVTDMQQSEFHRRGLEFKYLNNRKLQFIDIQNLFCETDKYARLAHPDIKGISKRTRIKQNFTATLSPINYFYPPKWNLCLD